MTKCRHFREMLAEDGIVVSPGVYDGYSALVTQAAGFKTCCTTGAGIANSRLGVPDIGIMGFRDNIEACRVIADTVDIPVMADADNGYGNAVTVHEVVRQFEAAGLVGINIEDQVIPKRCGHMAGKEVIDAREMAAKIEAACDARRDDDFVILARTDAIGPRGIDEAVRRVELYAKAGADMIFADAVNDADEIARVVEASAVPVSVNMGFGILSRPTTPLLSVEKLAELGVKRVTVPRLLPAVAIRAMQNALTVFSDSVTNGHTVERPDLAASIDEIWDLVGEERARELELRYSVD